MWICIPWCCIHTRYIHLVQNISTKFDGAYTRCMVLPRIPVYTTTAVCCCVRYAVGRRSAFCRFVVSLSYIELPQTIFKIPKRFRLGTVFGGMVMKEYTPPPFTCMGEQARLRRARRTHVPQPALNSINYYDALTGKGRAAHADNARLIFFRSTVLGPTSPPLWRGPTNSPLFRQNLAGVFPRSLNKII